MARPRTLGYYLVVFGTEHLLLIVKLLSKFQACDLFSVMSQLPHEHTNPQTSQSSGSILNIFYAAVITIMLT